MSPAALAVLMDGQRAQERSPLDVSRGMIE
jgi:hypothetical protein